MTEKKKKKKGRIAIYGMTSLPCHLPSGCDFSKIFKVLLLHLQLIPLSVVNPFRSLVMEIMDILRTSCIFQANF